MEYAALITAAGQSSRMGSFKPLLKIGKITMVQRVISTFQNAGISKIVLVVGKHGDDIVRTVEGQDIVFLRNENYEKTQMFDSAKIGISYMKSRCTRFFFCPVDVPLFSNRTVKNMMEARGKIVYPVYAEQTGHPILIDCSLSDKIIAYGGPNGLSGALKNLNEPKSYIMVPDKGILFDADTQDDFQKILQYYREGGG